MSPPPAGRLRLLPSLRGWVVQDSIYTRESKSKAQEFASKFELKEKELLLTKAHALSERRMLLLAASCVLTVLLFIILWTTFVNLQKTKKRNRIAAKQIDELLAQREELRKVFAQPKDTHGTTEGGEAGQLEEETSATVTETEVEVTQGEGIGQVETFHSTAGTCTVVEQNQIFIAYGVIRKSGKTCVAQISRFRILLRSTLNRL